MTGQLYQVDAPGYSAGMVVEGGVVTGAAPIIRWTVGREMNALKVYLEKRGYTVQAVARFGDKVMV